MILRAKKRECVLGFLMQMGILREAEIKDTQMLLIDGKIGHQMSFFCANPKKALL